jgi:hypothetical protein
MLDMKKDLETLKRVIREQPAKAETALAKLTEYAVGEVKLGMSNSPASGRRYRRGRRWHVASSKGKPPRPDTGALIGSIRQEKTGVLTRRLMDGVEYGFYQETVHERPFIRPVFERLNEGKALDILKKELGIGD